MFSSKKVLACAEMRIAEEKKKWIFFSLVLFVLPISGNDTNRLGMPWFRLMFFRPMRPPSAEQQTSKKTFKNNHHVILDLVEKESFA